MPTPSGVPRPFGGDLAERSRSARRQKDRSSTTTQGDGTHPGHDFCDDIDFTEEDPIIEEGKEDDREFDEYDPNADDDVKYEYAERPDAYEVGVFVDYSKIQNSKPKPRIVEKPPPWYFDLKDYKSVGGINMQHLTDRKSWDTMESGLQDAGFVGMDMPVEFKLKPGKGHHVVQMIRRGAIVETMDRMGRNAFLQIVDAQMKTGDHINWDEKTADGINNVAEMPMTEPDFERQVDFFASLTLPDGVESI
eukprot:2782975-Amphidinium_carterae.1